MATLPKMRRIFPYWDSPKPFHYIHHRKSEIAKRSAAFFERVFVLTNKISCFYHAAVVVTTYFHFVNLVWQSNNLLMFLFRKQIKVTRWLFIAIYDIGSSINDNC